LYHIVGGADNPLTEKQEAKACLAEKQEAKACLAEKQEAKACLVKPLALPANQGLHSSFITFQTVS
jgi:hypothetical protein